MVNKRKTLIANPDMHKNKLNILRLCSTKERGEKKLTSIKPTIILHTPNKTHGKATQQ
jgi:hypothetical protein